MMPTFDEVLGAMHAGDDAVVAETFEKLAKTTAGKATAWKVLGEANERGASGQSVRRDKIFYDREIRQMARIVAWRETRVTEQRSLSKDGAVHLRVLPSLADANQLIEGELDGAACEWGFRPQAGDLPDRKAHHGAREHLIRAGDVAGLEEYCRRYVRRILANRSDGRQFGAAPWTVDELLSEAVSIGERVEPVAFVLARDPSQFSLRTAAEQCVRGGRSAMLTLILERLDDIDTERSNDSLLALAVREKLAPAAILLLAKQADPNLVWHASSVRPPFERAASDGNGPMVNAVRNADVEMLHLLLAAGGDPFAKTFARRRVVDMAKELNDPCPAGHPHPGIVDLLEAGRSAPAAVDMETAIANGDVARVLELLPTAGSAKVIAACAYTERVPVLQAVLELGLERDPKVLAAALWSSSCNGHLATVALLLKHGADPNGHIDRSLGSARKIAETNRNGPIAALLKKAGGKIRVKP